MRTLNITLNVKWKKIEREILGDNHKANRTSLLSWNKHSSFPFIRVIESLLLVIEIDLLWSLRTRLPTEYKNAFSPLFLSLSLPYFASYHSMLTVNHYHHSYFLLPALYNRLFRSQHQTARSRENEKNESEETSLQQVSISFIFPSIEMQRVTCNAQSEYKSYLVIDFF